MKLILDRSDIAQEFKNSAGDIKVPDSELGFKHLTTKAQELTRQVGKAWLTLDGFMPPSPRWVRP